MLDTAIADACGPGGAIATAITDACGPGGAFPTVVDASNEKMKAWVKNEKVRSINVQATTVVCTPFAERGNIHGKHSFSAGSCFVRRAFASGDLRHDARQHRRSLQFLPGTVVPSGRQPYRGSTSYCSLYLSLWMN